jgi:hypothetical protein
MFSGGCTDVKPCLSDSDSIFAPAISDPQMHSSSLRPEGTIRVWRRTVWMNTYNLRIADMGKEYWHQNGQSTIVERTTFMCIPLRDLRLRNGNCARLQEMMHLRFRSVDSQDIKIIRGNYQYSSSTFQYSTRERLSED